MNFKEKLPFILSATVRSLIILTLGSFILYFVLSNLMSGRELVFLILYIPVAAITLFVTLALLIGELFKLKSFVLSGEIRNYTQREYYLLSAKSFLVVVCGLLMALIFGWERSLEEQFSWIDYLFYGSDLFLTLYALGNIVKGELLRDEHLRRVQSENGLLKSQLNPHFLYNTLNNIDALIWVSPEKASEALLKLSFLMRYMTYKASRKMVPALDEANYISEFVELQRIRLNNPLAIDCTLSIANDAPMIAPMLLIPFVENAFKHATERDRDGAIRIRFSAHAGGFEFESENESDSSKPISKDWESGVGLEIVKQRLQLLYPGKYALELRDEHNRYSVKLGIKI